MLGGLLGGSDIVDGDAKTGERFKVWVVLGFECSVLARLSVDERG